MLKPNEVINVPDCGFIITWNVFCIGILNIFAIWACVSGVTSLDLSFFNLWLTNLSFLELPNLVKNAKNYRFLGFVVIIKDCRTIKTLLTYRKYNYLVNKHNYSVTWIKIQNCKQFSLWKTHYPNHYHYTCSCIDILQLNLITSCHTPHKSSCSTKGTPIKNRPLNTATLVGCHF